MSVPAPDGHYEQIGWRLADIASACGGELAALGDWARLAELLDNDTQPAGFDPYRAEHPDETTRGTAVAVRTRLPGARMIVGPDEMLVASPPADAQRREA